MLGLFREAIDSASNASEFTAVVEPALSSGETTMDDAIAALTLCEATHL